MENDGRCEDRVWFLWSRNVVLFKRVSSESREGADAGVIGTIDGDMASAPVITHEVTGGGVLATWGAQ